MACAHDDPAGPEVLGAAERARTEIVGPGTWWDGSSPARTALGWPCAGRPCAGRTRTHRFRQPRRRHTLDTAAVERGLIEVLGLSAFPHAEHWRGSIAALSGFPTS